MADPIITVEDLGKRYRIRHQQQPRYHTLRDSLATATKRMFARPPEVADPAGEEDFWALKGVSFQINRGDIVGIIGRNGAGKSTLLKILSRITEPTTGRITLRGRVASLLEVGTGFHPELTGRENIFLNGAILGMTKAEIKKQFDEIVAFSEVEKFLDTPVKHYSSGMYTRLAFSVAAHLRSEVLIVDEVLAVGDQAFQNKCLGKLGTLSISGRTILFVTHNLEMVDRLTSRCILLKNGTVAMDASSNEAVSVYVADKPSNPSDISEYRAAERHSTCRICAIRIHSDNSDHQHTFREGEPIAITLTVDVPEGLEVDAGISIESSRQIPLFTSHISDFCEVHVGRGISQLTMHLDRPCLRRGTYFLSVALFRPGGREFFDVLLHIPLLEVTGTLDMRFPADDRWGELYFPLTWQTDGQLH
jgi:lipopolysaccharide transport system ATP-binding protein